MALRIPRGYAVNRPYFREVCEGTRPNSQAAPRLPFTGLAHVRIDEVHHDPIVIDAGTIIGIITGATGTVGGHAQTAQQKAFVAANSGYFVPAMIGYGTNVLANQTGVALSGILNNQSVLINIGTTDAETTWGIAGASGTAFNVNVGEVKPIGVVTQPVYSSYLPIAFTNYKRQHSLGFVTEYVIQIPATNDEEVAINGGDVVMLGSGVHHGAGVTSPYNAQKLAGRYAKYNTAVNLAEERKIGRCLKKTYLGQGGSTVTEGTILSSALSDFTASADLAAEFAGLERVQTVPGLTLSGSETKGVPTFLLGARADAQKRFWALTILVRI
jgi:hypothetical protein